MPVESFSRITSRATTMAMGLAHWWLSIFLALASAIHITQGTSSSLINENSAAVKPVAQVEFPDLYEASVLDLQNGLDAGHFTSVDLVKVYSIFLTAPSRATNG